MNDALTASIVDALGSGRMLHLKIWLKDRLASFLLVMIYWELGHVFLKSVPIL